MRTLLNGDGAPFGEDEDKIVELKLHASECKAKLPSVMELDTRLSPYELKEMLGVHDHPKPSHPVNGLVSFATDKDSIILDSFAGSGATAQAVLALNKQDGGNRRFVPVECGDHVNTITAERVRRVVKGVPNAKDKALREGLGGAFSHFKLGEALRRESMPHPDKPPSCGPEEPRDLAGLHESTDGPPFKKAPMRECGDAPTQPQAKTGWGAPPAATAPVLTCAAMALAGIGLRLHESWEAPRGHGRLLDGMEALKWPRKTRADTGAGAAPAAPAKPALTGAIPAGRESRSQSGCFVLGKAACADAETAPLRVRFKPAAPRWQAQSPAATLRCSAIPAGRSSRRTGRMDGCGGGRSDPRDAEGRAQSGVLGGTPGARHTISGAAPTGNSVSKLNTLYLGLDDAPRRGTLILKTAGRNGVPSGT